MTEVRAHAHVFERAELRHRDGAAIPGGRRCACGMEVVGDGFYSLNAQMVRASYEFNCAVATGMQHMARQMAENRRRMFP